MPERKLVSTKSFEKSYKKFAGSNARLKSSIHATLQQMETDVFAPKLKTHKLSVIYMDCSPARADTIVELFFQLKREK